MEVVAGGGCGWWRLWAVRLLAVEVVAGGGCGRWRLWAAEVVATSACPAFPRHLTTTPY